jgi:hypothetical protein
MMKLVVILSIVVGVLFVGLSIIYFITPANHLMHFIPGYSAVLTKHHFTHAVASLFLGLGCFAFAWFSSGKKSA